MDSVEDEIRKDVADMLFADGFEEGFFEMRRECLRGLLTIFSENELLTGELGRRMHFDREEIESLRAEDETGDDVLPDPVPDRSLDDEDRAILESATLLSDYVARAALAEDVDAFQLIVRIILDRPQLAVKAVRILDDPTNPDWRGVMFDVKAEDEKGNPVRIEIQFGNAGSLARRSRLGVYRALSFECGLRRTFMRSAEIWSVFILEKDPFGKGLPKYTMGRAARELPGVPCDFDDGTHIVLVNGSWTGDSEFGRLMHDLREPDPQKMFFSKLAVLTAWVKNRKPGRLLLINLKEMRDVERLEKVWESAFEPRKHALSEP